MAVLAVYDFGAAFPIPLQKMFNPTDILNRIEVDSATPVVRVRIPVTRRWTEDEAEFQAAIVLETLRTCAAQYARDKELEKPRKGKYPYFHVDSVRVVGINIQLEILLTDFSPAVKYLQHAENPPE